MEDVDTKQYTEPFPEHRDKLSVLTMGKLLSAFGNHEAKAFTLVIMDKGEVYNSGQLHSRYVGFQGENPGWLTNHRLQHDYCSYSLSPIGLVVKEELQPGSGQYGYRLSKNNEQGELSGEEGQLLAALLLDFSSRYPDVSLIDLFGKTNAPRKKVAEEDLEEEQSRAPINRWKIYQELATTNLRTIRQIDLANETGLGQSLLEQHLRELSRKKIIDYKDIELGDPVSYYSLKPNHPVTLPEHWRSYPTFTQRIYEILVDKNDRQLTLKEVFEIYKGAFDPEGKLNPKTTMARMSGVLNHLQSLDYLQKGRFGYESRTEVTISSEKQEMLLDLVSLLDRFQDQDPEILRQAEELLHGIRRDHGNASILMKKAHGTFAVEIHH